MARRNDAPGLLDYLARLVVNSQFPIIAGVLVRGPVYQHVDHPPIGQPEISLDLRPDGYQLIKFKEMVLKYLGAGALEHTVTAFWEYLLLLEICHKLLQKDRMIHTRDRRLSQPYRDLANLYQTDEYVAEGDFSERLSSLLQHITNDYQARYGSEVNRALSQQEITQLLLSPRC